MEGITTKYLVLICILLFTNSINSQDSQTAATTDYVVKDAEVFEQVLEGVIKINEVAPEPTEAIDIADLPITISPTTENDSEKSQNTNDENNAETQHPNETIEVQTQKTINDNLEPESATNGDTTNEPTEIIDYTDKVENNITEGTTEGTVNENAETPKEEVPAIAETTIVNLAKAEDSNVAEMTTTAEESNTEAPIEIPKNAAPLTACSEVGTFPHEHNCNSYYTCIDTTTGLERTDQVCPLKSAFNIELKRCTRDVSYCNDGAACLVAGSYEDNQSNASYYLCAPRLTGGFHKYHIECRTGEVFVPQLGKCFIDIDNLQNLPINYGLNNGQLDDEHIVKMELKEFKVAEKAKLKEQKLKEKLEKKLQDQLAKKAAKDAKEKAKSEKSKNKENFVCTQEGNFASVLNENRYFSCVSKKGKLKALNMICPAGHGFDQESSACIAIVNVLDEDDNDD